MKNTLIYLGLTLLMTACGSSSDTKTDKEEVNIPESPLKNAEAILQSKSGSEVTGNVIFTESYGTVSMIATVKNASPGEHAIHIHEEGDCSADDGSSAKGHWNPTGEEHGKWNSDSFHKGDIGNIVVDENGEGTISRDTDKWCLGCDNTTKDILGKAIIVHIGSDDFSSQPSGAAGERIACGEIVLVEN